jgi:predicted metal-dependent peptidase
MHRLHLVVLGRCLALVSPKETSVTAWLNRREWKMAVEQAQNVAKLAGKLTAGVTRCLEQSQVAGVDWRELLRRAWSEIIPSDYSWTPPNRRHIWTGLYLPSARAEGVGEIAITVNCSESVNGRQLGLFEGKFVPSSKVNDQAGCMYSISIPRSVRPRSIRRGADCA